MKNKTIYLTVIFVLIIYIILIIYARFYDKKDIEKVKIKINLKNKEFYF
jgi:hypothetical protein